MAKITHSTHRNAPRPRRRSGAPMEYHRRIDKVKVPWTDQRKEGVPYKYRYDLIAPGYGWAEIETRAKDIIRTTRYVPHHMREGAKPLLYGKSDPNRHIDLSKNIVDYLGGFLGFSWKRYKLGYQGIGGPNPFSLIIHGPRDFTVMIEDAWRPLMVEFVVAHEIGHYVMHTNGGRVPSAWPRISSGTHDAEATVFAAWWVLPDDQMEKIKKLSEGSITQAAYLVSEMFRWSRYIPATGIPRKNKVRKRKSVYKSHLSDRQRLVLKMRNPTIYDDT